MAQAWDDEYERRAAEYERGSQPMMKSNPVLSRALRYYVNIDLRVSASMFVGLWTFVFTHDYWTAAAVGASASLVFAIAE